MVSLRQSVTPKVSPVSLVMVMKKLLTCWFTCSSNSSSTSPLSSSSRQENNCKIHQQDYFAIKRPPGFTLNKFKVSFIPQLFK